MAERGNGIPLAATQEVGAFGELILSVPILVKPIGKKWRDRAHCAHVIARWLPVAKVKLIQLMATLRKVDGGWLVSVQVQRVRISVLLRWHPVVVFYRKYL
jgi:hypothetical protein